MGIQDLQLEELVDFNAVRLRRDRRVAEGWTETEADVAQAIEYKLTMANKRVLEEAEVAIRDFGYVKDRVNGGSHLFDSLNHPRLLDAAATREVLIEVLTDLFNIVISRLIEDDDDIPT